MALQTFREPIQTYCTTIGIFLNVRPAVCFSNSGPIYPNAALETNPSADQTNQPQINAHLAQRRRSIEPFSEQTALRRTYEPFPFQERVFYRFRWSR